MIINLYSNPEEFIYLKEINSKVHLPNLDSLLVITVNEVEKWI